MTQKLIDKLIAHYEQAIKDLQTSNTEDALSYIGSKRVDSGICFCAQEIFHEYIYTDEWVRSFGTGGHWFRPPYVLGDTKGIINALQLRVDRMKTFSE